MTTGDGVSCLAEWEQIMYFGDVCTNVRPSQNYNLRQDLRTLITVFAIYGKIVTFCEILRKKVGFKKNQHL